MKNHERDWCPKCLAVPSSRDCGWCVTHDSPMCEGQCGHEEGRDGLTWLQRQRRPLPRSEVTKVSAFVGRRALLEVTPMRVDLYPPDTTRGFMRLIARDGNGTTLLTADEARTLARRLDAAARELER